MGKQFFPNQNGNIEIPMSDGPNIELFLDEKCPKCKQALGDHLGIFCRYFESMTLDELIRNGYGRRLTDVLI